MDIVVCIKVLKESLTYHDFWVSNQISFCDIYSLSLAMKLKNKYGANVCVLSMGPNNTRNVLDDLYILGIDNIILLSDDAFAGSDTLATSYILSKALEVIPHDLIMCGAYSDDSATGQVALQLANRLKYKFVLDVNDIELFKKGIRFKTDKEILVGNCPMLLTVKSKTQPPFPNLLQIKNSLNKKVNILNHLEINADLNFCGLNGSPTKIRKVCLLNKHMNNREHNLLSGTLNENVNDIVNIVNKKLHSNY